MAGAYPAAFASILARARTPAWREKMVATFEPKTDYKVIGTRPIRHDGYDKVTGRAIYGGDLTLPGLIWGVCVRSPHAHANIK